MDDIEDIDDNITLELISMGDQTIMNFIKVKKYFTCSQLIFYINQFIKENYPSFRDIIQILFVFIMEKDYLSVQPP